MHNMLIRPTEEDAAPRSMLRSMLRSLCRWHRGGAPGVNDGDGYGYGEENVKRSGQ